jgi:hypothetical protein
MQNLRPQEVEVPTYPSRPTQLLVFHLLGLGSFMSRILEFMSNVKKAETNKDRSHKNYPKYLEYNIIIHVGIMYKI